MLYSINYSLWWNADDPSLGENPSDVEEIEG